MDVEKGSFGEMEKRFLSLKKMMAERDESFSTRTMVIGVICTRSRPSSCSSSSSSPPTTAAGLEGEEERRKEKEGEEEEKKRRKEGKGFVSRNCLEFFVDAESVGLSGSDHPDFCLAVMRTVTERIIMKGLVSSSSSPSSSPRLSLVPLSVLSSGP